MVRPHHAVLLFLGSLSLLRSATIRADELATRPSPALTLDQCIAIALQKQPGIRAQEAGIDMAREQQKVARSYFLPQAGVQASLTQMNKPLYVISPSPLSGSAANVFADAAAFFGIARQAGPAAAELALAHPNAPPFSTAEQAALASIPTSLQTNLLGDRFLLADAYVNQALYAGGRIRARNQQAKLGIEAAQNDVIKAKQETVFEVTKAYNGILLSYSLVEVTSDVRGRFKAIEALAQSALEEDEKSVSRADPTRARSLRLLAEGQVVKFERTRDLAYVGLRTAMGLDPQGRVEIADRKLRYVPAQLVLAELVNQAIAQRPEIKKVNLAIQNAVLEKKVATGQFLPEVGLYGHFYSIHDDASYANPTNPNLWTAGIQANLPLFTGGRRMAERRKADYQAAQARALLQRLEQGVALEVEQAFLEYKEMTERVHLAKKAVDETEQALKSYENQFAIKGDRLDLAKHFTDRLSTSLLLVQARLTYYEDIHAYNLALAKITLVTGSSNEVLPSSAGSGGATGH